MENNSDFNIGNQKIKELIEAEYPNMKVTYDAFGVITKISGFYPEDQISPVEYLKTILIKK